jgi:hypothetical protein
VIVIGVAACRHRLQFKNGTHDYSTGSGCVHAV